MLLQLCNLCQIYFDSLVVCCDSVVSVSKLKSCLMFCFLFELLKERDEFFSCNEAILHGFITLFGQKYCQNSVQTGYHLSLTLNLLNFLKWRYQNENLKLITQQYRAWLDCIETLAGLALYWLQKLITSSSSRIRVNCLQLVYGQDYVDVTSKNQLIRTVQLKVG